MNLSVRSKLHGIRLACALLVAGISAPATAEWLLDADAGVLYDSNLNRAHKSADVRADGAFTLNAAGGSYYALSGADGLTLTANGRSEIYHRFHGLNLLSLGGTALYRHKFGLGYAAPWIVLAASASHDNYRDNIRDSDRAELRAELGKRFTESFDAAFGGRVERRYAKTDAPVVPGISGKVFDLRGRSAYVRAGYAVSDQLLLGVELAVRRGDVVATTRRDFQIFVVSDAIAPDPTFGSDFFAYRLCGTTDTAKLTASWALDNRSSLNLAYADERTDATGGIIYRSHSANLVFAWRY
jgi:hypothetical protein